MSKEKEIRKYLEEKVDPFLKPLLLDLMKVQPENVYPYLKDWIHGKGQEIKNSQDAQNQIHQSVHYDEFKQSVIDVQPPQIDEPAPQEESPAPQEENPAPQEENPAPQGENDAPQDPPTEPAPEE